MPIYIDTRGKTPIAVALCARCGLKFPRAELEYDLNYPGLLVCKDDADRFDPYRLPARITENITLKDPRPDSDIFGFGPTPLYGQQQFAGVTQLNPVSTWQPNTNYMREDTITPKNPDADTTQNPQYQFAALNAGTSGGSPPVWPTNPGVKVVDGTITWFCVGLNIL